MIRILHTGDWHIGQTLRGFSREYEHRKVFERLGEIVAEREIDALIVAGDVFDSQNPSGEAQQLFYDTLACLSRARPRMTTVIVAGNHDAAGRLEAPRPLFEAFNIHVIGNVRRRDGRIDATRHLVPIHDATGAMAAHVLAVSYPTAACLPTKSVCISKRSSTVLKLTRATPSWMPSSSICENGAGWNWDASSSANTTTP
jgi:exonuclease SbcD